MQEHDGFVLVLVLELGPIHLVYHTRRDVCQPSCTNEEDTPGPRTESCLVSHPSLSSISWCRFPPPPSTKSSSVRRRGAKTANQVGSVPNSVRYLIPLSRPSSLLFSPSPLLCSALLCSILPHVYLGALPSSSARYRSRTWIRAPSSALTGRQLSRPSLLQQMLSPVAARPRPLPLPPLKHHHLQQNDDVQLPFWPTVAALADCERYNGS